MKIALFTLILVLIVSCKNAGRDESKSKEVIIANKDELNKSLTSEDITDSIDTPGIVTDTLSVTSEDFVTNNCTICDIKVIKAAKKKLHALSYQDIYNLLCTFSKECSDNAEYTEFSNAILFNVISRYPRPLIEILTNNPTLDHDYIYAQLASPILDYDYQAIISVVKKVKNSDECKNRIILALEKAINQP